MEKSKLLKLSTKSWHYKLIKFMFSWAVPEPRNISNLVLIFG